MTGHNHEEMQIKIEKKLARRETKKRPKMKVSGRQVLKLQEIIKEKGKE